MILGYVCSGHSLFFCLLRKLFCQMQEKKTAKETNNNFRAFFGVQKTQRKTFENLREKANDFMGKLSKV